jgi:cytochrome c oxidase subunit IV
VSTEQAQSTVKQPPAAAREHAHPGPAEYVKIALILAVITGAEVGIYYMKLGTGVLTGLLLFFSVIKFAMVVLWFMHLKFDSKLFRRLFITGLALALSVYGVVLATFFLRA